jgi:hypothetical protein
MKQVLGSIGRASLAAAGVMVATSAANAESRPLAFETEFDLNLAPTPAPLNIAVPDVTKWEQSIGAYLDGLLTRDEAAAATSAAEQAAGDPGAESVDTDEVVDTDQVVAEDIRAFQPVQAAAAIAPVEANLLLLAPVLSQPMHCEQCDAETTTHAQLEAEVKIDDSAAWQKLAEWASARVAEDEAAADFDAAVDAPFNESDVVTAESIFFEDGTDDSPTK